MMENNKKINPKSKFKILKNDHFSQIDLVSLGKLYLPIIGSEAYALVNFMWLESEKEHEFFEIMSSLSFDGELLYNSLLKLEGTDLLKTFVDSDEETYLVLIPPLSATNFFKSGLLSEFLLEIVGETKYLDLANTMLPKRFNVGSMDDQTHNFLQVFSIDSQKLTDVPDVISNVQSSIEKASSTSDETITDNLDFNLMLSILENSYVNIDDVKKNHQLFISTKVLYGISEVTLAKYVEQATNLNNNHFDAQKFKVIVSRNNEIKRNVVSNEIHDEKKDNQTPITNLSQQEQALVTSAKSIAPLVFLNSIKQQKGGFTTSGEERIISNLVDKMVLKTDVINILIYSLLVDNDYPTLNRNLVDTIANDWSQSKITTAEQALNQIKTRDQKISKEKATKQRNRSRKQLNVKETLPDWAKNSGNKNVKNTPISSEQKISIEERLKELNRKNRGD
ncbi:DnaD domain protein [Fructilactobacillus vespulae]